MVRLLRSHGPLVQSHWTNTTRAMFNLTRYRRIVEAVIESAAIYSLASISLVVTIFVSPNIGYAACMYVFPPLIVCFSLPPSPHPRMGD